MRISWMAAAAACAALGAGSAAAEPIKTTFELVGKPYNVTIPDGFCPLNDQTRPVFDTIAAADAQNLTDFTFVDCKIAEKGVTERRYGIIKTPKSTLLTMLPPRAELLKQFAASITDGSMAKAMKDADVSTNANKALKDTTGMDLHISGEPRFVETDDKAAYMIAVMSGGLEGATRKFSMAAAITEVNGRIISWYLYGPYESDADVARLLGQTKVQIAQFVADNGG